MKRRQLTTLLLATLLPLAACSGAPADAAREAERAVAQATGQLDGVERKVREELATGNIDFGGHHRDGGSNGGSDAEITPAGDLLIDGKPVAIDQDEREMLLDYREHVTEVALAGARIGVQGAALAATAMREAFNGVFSGDTGGIDAKVGAEAEKIRAQVVGLCDRLGPMLETQQALAAAIPELVPYATMTEKDIADCYDDSKEAIGDGATAAD